MSSVQDEDPSVQRYRRNTEWDEAAESEAARLLDGKRFTPAFRRWSVERGHMKLYEAAILQARRLDAPEWHELSEEQRISVRQTNREYEDAMADIGVQLRAAPARP